MIALGAISLIVVMVAALALSLNGSSFQGYMRGSYFKKPILTPSIALVDPTDSTTVNIGTDVHYSWNPSGINFGATDSYAVQMVCANDNYPSTPDWTHSLSQFVYYGQTDLTLAMFPTTGINTSKDVYCLWRAAWYQGESSSSNQPTTVLAVSREVRKILFKAPVRGR